MLFDKIFHFSITNLSDILFISHNDFFLFLRKEERNKENDEKIQQYEKKMLFAILCNSPFFCRRSVEHARCG